MRSLAARRQLLARMGVTLAEGEDPGPVDMTSPAVQKAVAALYAERFPGDPPKPAADVTPRAWHAQLLDKLIAEQPLPQDALAALERERGNAVQAQLVKAALPEAGSRWARRNRRTTRRTARSRPGWSWCRVRMKGRVCSG